jgi:threonine dehydrogenase-like Zn-dependent dehydrogenase
VFLLRTLIVDERGNMSIGEAPIPKCGEYQALVKMISGGVCGTDMKIWHGKFKGMVFENDYPMMIGHEGVGRVVEIGAKVTSFKIGDAVLLPYVDPIGDLKSGWGAFSEYGIVHDAAALERDGYKMGHPLFPEGAYAQTVVPPDIDPVDASMIVTLREVLSSIKTFGITPNSSVVVFGCGPVGATFIRFMNLLGVHPIIVFDIDEQKLDIALKKGATYAFNSGREDVLSRVREICPDGVDFTLDAVGYLPLINQAMEMIKDRGKICCYGVPPDNSSLIDWSKAPYNWNLCFQQMPRKQEEGEANNQVLAWLRMGVITLKEFISDYADFDDIIDVFDRAQKRQIALKCIIKF